MADETEPTFEEALGQIERIVSDLERGEPALDAALHKYENGVKLLSRCYRLLEQAEQSVALLTGTDDEGNPLITPFDATATFTQERGTSHAPAKPEAKPKRSDRISRIQSTSSDHDSAGIEPPF